MYLKSFFFYQKFYKDVFYKNIMLFNDFYRFKNILI